MSIARAARTFKRLSITLVLWTPTRENLEVPVTFYVRRILKVG